MLRSFLLLTLLAACGGRIAVTTDGGIDPEEPDPQPHPNPTASGSATSPVPTTQPSNKPRGDCPEQAGVGAGCSKEGLVCDFPDTCTPGQNDRMRCSNGKWSFADGDPYVASCPARAPRHGEKCLCRHLFAPCEYGSCDGQTVPTRASCNLQSQMWLVDVIVCKEKDGG